MHVVSPSGDEEVKAFVFAPEERDVYGKGSPPRGIAPLGAKSGNATFAVQTKEFRSYGAKSKRRVARL
jgi:hypothetical protein